MSATVELLKELIYRKSITPHDDKCQEIIAARLRKLNFLIEHLKFGETENLWARLGDKAPLFVFAGHTDVVPPGPEAQWLSDPFTPTVRENVLYGRGATDMKSGLAAMVIATENFLKTHPTFNGSIGFLLTSDEEGPGHDGTVKVLEALRKRNIQINYSIVGEASSEKKLGDQIRVGRRGSFHGKLTIEGKQGHVAYPHLADNPIHKAFIALENLTKEKWDDGNEHFPPTSFQISNIHAGTGAANVIPGILDVQFNFRFSPTVTINELKHRVEEILHACNLKFKIDWHVSANPFLSQQGKLVSVVKNSIHELVGLEPRLSTGGGTSDARFIAAMGADVVELGPIAETAHHANEHIDIKDLNKLTEIYEKVLEKIFF